MRRAWLTFFSAFALAQAACAPKSVVTEPSPKAVPTAPEAAIDKGPPWEFALDPVDKEQDHVPESQQLLGKRAVVLVAQSFDGASLAGLRTLEPILAALPPDAACLLVAVQPLGDRAIVGMFFDGIKSPCRRAIGDVKRGRLGDLAKIQVVPTVLVLRKDGTVVGGYGGAFTEKQVRELLEKAY